MKEVYLYEKTEAGKVRCKNCAHYCIVAPGARGICGVRQNFDGKLYALNYSKAVALNIDPIGKKPLFHFLPGTSTLSIATVGCNLFCANCQNWNISQYPKTYQDIPGEDILPKQAVKLAQENNLPSISYTYVEPTIFSEYALDTMKIARKKGLKNIWVSNGFMSSESREMIIPYLDANNIDIKGFSDEFYFKNCKSRLQPVLDTAKAMKKAGVWLEITTLIIPTLNDDNQTLSAIAKFIAQELGKETPWHVTQFSSGISWKLKHLPNTSANTIRIAYNIGKSAGLKYVYSGNIPGLPTDNTFCPKCNNLCIERSGYNIKCLYKGNKCQKCGANLDIIEIKK